MTAKILPAIAVLAALGAASAASANTLVTFTGTLNYGTDYTGVFGTPGATLAGDSFVTSYVIDPTMGIQQNDSTSNFTYGGSDHNSAAFPVISASLTINGITLDISSIGPATNASAYGYNNGSSSEQEYRYDYQLKAGAIGYSYDLTNGIRSPTPSLPKSLTTPFSYTVTPLQSRLLIFTILVFLISKLIIPAP